MDTRKIATEYRLTQWAKVMSKRKEKGLSIKAFCESAGIHPNVYYYLQRKLREAACERISSSGELVTTGFTEVKLMDPPAAPKGGTTTRLQIEMKGMQITADSAYPVDRLAELLRELVQSC